MNKLFRMISLTAEALSIELEVISEKDSKYEEIFRKDFSREIRYLMVKEERRQRNLKVSNRSPQEIENQFLETKGPPDGPKVLKDIYRSLAKVTHPDVAGLEYEEEFKEIKNSYAENDIIGLMMAANRNGISPEIDDEDLKDLQEILERQKKEIDEIKQTVRWQWGESLKSPDLRMSIRTALGINNQEYSNWIRREDGKEAKRKKEQRDRDVAEKSAARKKRIRGTPPPARNASREKDLRRRRKS